MFCIRVKLGVSTSSFLFTFASLNVLFSLITSNISILEVFFCLFLKIIFLLKLNTTLSYII